MGALKGRLAIRVFKQFTYFKKRPYWGNDFWAKGYCVDTVGLGSDTVRKYVKRQEKLEKKQEFNILL
jgi:putative transposase